MTNAVIKLGPGMEAFAQGAVAADEVTARVAELMPTGTYDARTALFWLKIGQRAHAYTEQAAFDMFIAGVMTRQPERTGVHVELDTSGPAFHRHDPDAPGYDFDADDQDFRREVRLALKGGIDEIADGSDEGTLHDSYGRVVGLYRVNHN